MDDIQGVPLRLELGPNDHAKQQVTAVRRDTGAKEALPIANLSSSIKSLLDRIQADLFATAKQNYENCLSVVKEWKAFVPALNEGKVCVVPWCEQESCEDGIKDQSAKEFVLCHLSPLCC